MKDDRLSRPATGARTPRAAVLLAVVIVSLAGCSADERAGTDTVVAIEEAQAEAAAEVAEAQAAIDRQVEAADAQKADARAAADEAARQTAAADTAKRAAADQAAADKAAAQRAAAAGAPARRAAAGAAVKTGPRPRTPASTPGAPSRGTAAKEVVPPAVAPSRPVPARPPRAAAVRKPVVPKPRPPVVPKPRPAAVPKPRPAVILEPRPAGTTPGGPPQGTVFSTDDLHVVLAPQGGGNVWGHESAAAGCQSEDFHAGERVRLITTSGVTVHETVLPACELEVVPAPATGVATSSPRFFVTLRALAWRHGDAWVLEIGTHQWPVTASTLSAYGWSIAVTAGAGVTAGPAVEPAETRSS